VAATVKILCCYSLHHFDTIPQCDKRTDERLDDS